LFLSAFGFFFSRLLLSCPFAISSSILHRHGSAVARRSGGIVPVRRLSRDYLRLQFVLPKLQGLLLAGTTPTVDGEPQTSEPPCRERLIDIDGFAGHGRAPISGAFFVWKA